MQAYKSHYHPGALDSSELDPCIAAETRLKKSAFSTRRKRSICVIAALVIFLFLVCALIAALVISSSSSAKTADVVADESSVPHSTRPPAYQSGDDAIASSEDVDIPPPPVNDDPEVHRGEYREPHRLPLPRDDVTTTTKKPSLEGVIVVPISSRHESLEEFYKKLQTNRYEKAIIPVAVVDSTPPTTRMPFTTTTTTTTTQRPTTSTRRTTQKTTEQPSSAEEGYMLVTSEVKESCRAHASSGLGSGVYRIKPEGAAAAFDAYCEMEIGEERDAGWMVIQRMASGPGFHHEQWHSFERGFGSVHHNHWIGLEKILQAAPARRDGILPATLRIELHGDTCPVGLKSCSGQPDGYWWGEWDFGLGPSFTHYPLHISPATGGNLTLHNEQDYFYKMNNGMPFTTPDKDNDKDPSLNCAGIRNFGAWWHKDCTNVALNGMYGDDTGKYRYQVWFRQAIGSSGKPYYIHPLVSTMMIRPKN